MEYKFVDCGSFTRQNYPPNFCTKCECDIEYCECKKEENLCPDCGSTSKECYCNVDSGFARGLY